jgi:hypothetical protein
MKEPVKIEGGCEHCYGSGKIADDDEKSPWPLWEALEFPENIAVVYGIVKPIPCPTCGGTGKPQGK